RARELLQTYRHPAPGKPDVRSFEWYYLWNLCDPEIRKFAGHEAKATCVTFDTDGRRMASGGADRTVRVWDGATGRAIHVLRGHSGTINRLAFSPDGTRLASVGGDRTVRIWDLANGACVGTIPTSGQVRNLAFTPDGRGLYTPILNEGRIILWD